MSSTHRVFIHTRGPGDWRSRLASPDKHWKRKRSAFEVAVSWETARSTERGMPEPVANALDEVGELSGAKVLLAIAEHAVPMPGRGGDSKSDVWALLNVGPDSDVRNGRFVSLVIEGKADEGFDKPVKKWLAEGQGNRDGGRNREDRLRGVCKALGLDFDTVKEQDEIGYQLFHRTASAVLEADRFRAAAAIMLVQAFGETDEVSFRVFRLFAQQLGVNIGTDPGKRVWQGSLSPSGLALYVGWVKCPLATDKQVAGTVE